MRVLWQQKGEKTHFNKHIYTETVCILKCTLRKPHIGQKSGEVAGERGMSQWDLLLDRDSPLRIELQLQPSVSALNRETHLTQHVISYLSVWAMDTLKFEFCLCLRDWCMYTSIKCHVYLWVSMQIHMLVVSLYCNTQRPTTCGEFLIFGSGGLWLISGSLALAARSHAAAAAAQAAQAGL